MNGASTPRPSQSAPMSTAMANHLRSPSGSTRACSGQLRASIGAPSGGLPRSVETTFDGPDGDLGAASHTELPEDVLDVVRDATLREDQAAGNLGVGQPLCDQHCDLLFPAGDPAVLVDGASGGVAL